MSQQINLGTLLRLSDSPGTQVSVTGTTNFAQLPLGNNGKTAKAVLLTCTAYTHVGMSPFSTVNQTCTVANCMISPNFPQTLFSQGQSYISFIQDAPQGTPIHLNVQPLEM